MLFNVHCLKCDMQRKVNLVTEKDTFLQVYDLRGFCCQILPLTPESFLYPGTGTPRSKGSCRHSSQYHRAREYLIYRSEQIMTAPGIGLAQVNGATKAYVHYGGSIDLTCKINSSARNNFHFVRTGCFDKTLRVYQTVNG